MKRAVLFIVLIAALFVAFKFLPVTEYLGRFLEQVQNLGVWGPVILGLVYVIATVAMVSTNNVRERVARQKLERDVATINRAIQLYELNGGNLGAWNWEQSVINKLKAKSNDLDAEKTAGLTGRYLDSRLQPMLGEPSSGRFIVEMDGFLEPRELQPGTPVTVRGRVVRLVDGKIGEAPDIYPA